MTGYGEKGVLIFETFNQENKAHVNILIGNIIDDIENVLRFTMEKYFSNYYSLLTEVAGEKNAGANWAAFLEYGTQNSIVIALQNIGLSRHTANYIYNYHRNTLTIEDDNLIDINKTLLVSNIDKDGIEYEEIKNLI